jgi:hypothetical protein
MSFWSVDLDFPNVTEVPDLEDRVDELLEDLVSYSAVVAYDQDWLSLRLAIEKVPPEQVVEQALRPAMRARALRGLGSSLPARIEIQAVEDPSS